MSEVRTTEWTQLPSGLILPYRAAEEHVRRWRRPVAMDFFCGAGGMSLGLIQGGFEVLAAAEWDTSAALTYMTNLSRYGELQIHCVTDEDRARLEKALAKSWKDQKELWNARVAGTGWISHEPRSTPGVSHFFFGDIAQLTGEKILKALGLNVGELDLIAGSPPCQGYSKAGKQRVDDPRNELTFEFARLICEMRPKTIVMENVTEVATMLSPDGVPVLDKFCRILEDGGFGGYAGFQKSIEAQTGRIGLLRGSNGAKRKQYRKPPKRRIEKPIAIGQPTQAQSDLFAEASR
jgi:DNA (cytosine-5)-methyltransferase 1